MEGDNSEEKNKGGRPLAWDKVKTRLPEVEKLRGRGATMAQVAKFLGVSPSTVFEMKRKFSEFSECLSRAREARGDFLEGELWKLACGRSQRVETVEQVGEDGKLHIVSRRVIVYENHAGALLAILKQQHGWKKEDEDVLANTLTDTQLRAKFCERLGLSNYCNAPASRGDS